MSGKYRLGICNLYNSTLHGEDENSSSDINSHYLVYTTIDPNEFYCNEYKSLIITIRRGYMYWVRHMNYENNIITHPTIRNFYKIINTKSSYKIDIVQIETLSGGEEVCYIKTFWIKIIQRKWRKVYNERKRILKIRQSVISQRERQMTGKWPQEARDWPMFNLYR